MKDIILFPFGGNAREAVMAILALNSIEPMWNILGFVDDNADLYGKECCGFRVIGDREKLGVPECKYPCSTWKPRQLPHTRRRYFRVGYCS